jgi:adenylate cyclase
LPGLTSGRSSLDSRVLPISGKYIFARKGDASIIPPMRLPPTIAWLVDEASAVRGADRLLATLGAKLVADGLPLAGGALTLTAAHPIIARRTWLWRAETRAVIEALGFGSIASAEPGEGPEHGKVGRDWLATLGAGRVQEDIAGPTADSPALAWAMSRPLAESESALLRQAARFAAAPLAVLSSRATLAALLEAYLGRRGAGRVLAGRSRRETGETIRAVLLFGDLRDFTELSESIAPDAVVATLDAWFDRVAGAVHAFGGEVLKFIGDGVLAIFPIGERPASVACDAALNAVGAAQAGMAHLDQARVRQDLPRLRFGVALHLGEMMWGNVGTADRLDFTAIGPAVNLVSRLEGLCRPLARSVLVSGAVAAETTRALVPLGEHPLRGIAAPCAVFTLP